MASPLEAVLRRDRWVVGDAIDIIVTRTWSYVLWLANDMDMGGMDMSEFRMIPAVSCWCPCRGDGRPASCSVRIAFRNTASVTLPTPSAP